MKIIMNGRRRYPHQIYKSKILWTKSAPPLSNDNGRGKILSPDINMVSKEESFKGEIHSRKKLNTNGYTQKKNKGT